jgi:hypothetical protein
MNIFHHINVLEQTLIRSWLPSGLKTKNDCAHKGQQQLTGLNSNSFHTEHTQHHLFPEHKSAAIRRVIISIMKNSKEPKVPWKEKQTPMVMTLQLMVKW